MKQIFFIQIVFFISFISFGQIEVTEGKFPFNQIIEWPGKGTLLLGNDPTGRTDEINFNLLNHQGEVSWNRSVYPKSNNTSLIVSGMSDYLYFVDDLKPVNNHIRYNQVNQSGSIVPTKFDLLKVIRSYRYTTPNDLELKEIVNTPKALVFYFQLPVKDKGIIENFFVTITHHNNRVYHYQGPASDMTLMKEGKEGPLVFAGADENTICFSRYEYSDKKQNARFYPFSPKAEPISRNTMIIPDFSPILSTIQEVSLHGSHYIEKENKSTVIAEGKGIYMGGKYFYAVNDAKDRCLKIYGRDDNGKYVLLNKCENVAEASRKYKASLAIIPFRDKAVIVSNINDNSIAYELTDNKLEKVASETLNFEILQKNPSSFKVENKSANFVHFKEGLPYFFDLKNIKDGNKVIFKQ
ncbi:hypothetical protein [Brumimicrobium sp.]|uniref:hypothetical protein n=1 Tax=Brumimicrobium sp. TaxID=2029867 RepID=UPI0026203611|nr:hypothetical protein [uncultured Brumimicrobium sp.]